MLQLPNIADLQLLRARVRLFLKVMFGLHLGFNLASGVLRTMLLDSANLWPRNRFSAVRLLSFAVTALLGLSWLSARRLELSRRALSLIETLGTMLLCGGYVLYLLFGPLHFALVPSVLLMMAVALVLRAALVPSEQLRTVLVSLPPLVALVLVAGFVRPHDQVMAAWAAVFGTAVVVVAQVISRVVYRLRVQVTQARQMGQYALGRKLGEGANGEVYEATHVLLRRPTAVKLLPVARAGETAVARFEREVRHTSRLEHPNSIRIYDYGRTPDGIFYYAMELLDGVTLGELVEHWGAQPQGRVKHLMLQACNALAEAHAMSLVHRDIKPPNLMLSERGGVPDMLKVLDFGLVKPLPKDAIKPNVTQTDTVVGTPHYMAPEAFTDPEKVGAAADVYGVAAVAYLVLTGEELFPGDTLVEVGWKHVNVAPTAPSEKGVKVDAAFEALLLRCLAKDAADRPADAAELASELEALGDLGWSRADAHAWWQTHTAEVAQLHGGKGAGEAAAAPTGLDVDLSSRAAA